MAPMVPIDEKALYEPMNSITFEIFCEFRIMCIQKEEAYASKH